MTPPRAVVRVSAYSSALRRTLRNTAAAYGYTLTIATTIGTLNSTHGRPDAGDLFLFASGGLAAFALLEGVVSLLPSPGEDRPEQAFPLAGALNFVSVGAALGVAVGAAHAVAGAVAWLLAPGAATAVYMGAVALQVTLVDVIRRRR